MNTMKTPSEFPATTVSCAVDPAFAKAGAAFDTALSEQNQTIGWHHIDFDKVPGPDGFILRLGFQKAYKKKAVTLLPCCFCKGNA